MGPFFEKMLDKFLRISYIKHELGKTNSKEFI